MAQSGQLMLAAHNICIRKSGIEFHSDHPIPPWTEMTVTLQIPREARKVNCNGVIVACAGDDKAGYSISMLFTHLSRQSQVTLGALAR